MKYCRRIFSEIDSKENQLSKDSLYMNGFIGLVISIARLLVCSTVLIFLSGCSETKTKQISDETVVATVGDSTILSADLIERLVVRTKGSNQSDLSQQQKLSVLNEIIDREVQIAAARAAGFDNDPAIVEALENLMINKLRSDHLEKLLSEIKISPTEIDTYYQQNLQKYSTPAMTRLAIIRLSLSPQANSDKRTAIKARAEQAYQLALTLPDSVNGFGTLAAKYSDHQASRYAGGDMGWIKIEVENRQVDAAIPAALAQLKQNGDLAPLVEGGDGYYLIKLLDRRAAKQQSIEYVGSSIQLILEREARKKVEADWLLSLQNKGKPLFIDEDVLAALKLPLHLRSQPKQSAPPKLPNK